MRVDVVGGERGAGSQCYRRDNRLAPLVVRHANHGHFGHAPALGDGVLHRVWIDVEAAGHDHIVLPVAQNDVAAPVHRAKVARLQPFAIDGALAEFGQVEIALHHGIAYGNFNCFNST